MAALLPVNANEIELAAQCIAARGQAEEMLRLVRQNANDIELVMRLNAQYGSMVRTSLAVHGRLMRVQAVRQKREAIEGAATEDAWTLHVAERSMLRVVNPDAGRVEAARPKAAAVAALAEAPAACMEQKIEANVSGYGMKSHDAAFETRSSEQARDPAYKISGRTGMGEIIRRAMARSRSEAQDLTANGQENCGSAE